MFEFCFVIIFFYSLGCILLIVKWLLISIRPKNSTLSSDNKISVIIAVRNEAANIAALIQDLEGQTLPKNQYEVIVIDDASTDNTAQIVKDFTQKTNTDIRLLSLQDEATTAPKKRALSEGIKIAKGRLIVTTDGDCRLNKKWLETINGVYVETGAKFLSGPVSFLKESRFFDCFQTIEFGSLIGAGACLLESGFPTMCNGANLAFEKAVFEEVGGYTNIDHIASGDDEFLMAKIAQKYPDKIVFIKNQNAIVQTTFQDNLTNFTQQRIRWASKWAVNRRLTTMAVALFVYCVNVSLILLSLAVLTSYINFQNLSTLLAIKFIPEFVFLSLICWFSKKYWLILLIPFVQILYPFYVFSFGLLAQRKHYEWKGRTLK